ncbi:hypothetical protein ACFWFU_13660 [Streptomyces sp. NPDC060235]|uniref:hypothetical protein n=1 Tax=Streptomyces sp. NPDC060235 TaxID=3347080 RepID=UPI00365D9651
MTFSGVILSSLEKVSLYRLIDLFLLRIAKKMKAEYTAARPIQIHPLVIPLKIIAIPMSARMTERDHVSKAFLAIALCDP